MDKPTISVIIPTVKRPAVRAAVLSALNQTYPPHEVIVVVDRPGDQIPEVLHDLTDRISIVFSGGVGPSGARARAFLESSGEIIAFLDDDDQWLPEKLERQVAMRQTADANRLAMVTCRWVTVDPLGNARGPLPLGVLAPGEKIASYLFRRANIRYHHGAINPSAVICDRDLLKAEPWNESLRLHEDWNWLLRIDSRPDVDILMCPDVLLEVAAGDAASLSRSSKWEQSFAWLQQHAEYLTPREQGDFLLVFTALIAVWSGERRSSLRIAWYALTRARPGLHAWLVWTFNMLPSSVVSIGTRILHRIASLRGAFQPQQATAAGAPKA
jgi:glycosyltransferase involved in cell wall biosynthesis